MITILVIFWQVFFVSFYREAISRQNNHNRIKRYKMKNNLKLRGGYVQVSLLVSPRPLFEDSINFIFVAFRVGWCSLIQNELILLCSQGPLPLIPDL